MASAIGIQSPHLDGLGEAGHALHAVGLRIGSSGEVAEAGAEVDRALFDQPG
ncbi:hypothetical protein ACFQY5_11885 [Paeniroseomonas aquatica]|uniref:hypothetical protein n=1 Tax=Paeniroseomonas aquatica TaxID=373043 RepID=UPI00361E965F